MILVHLKPSGAPRYISGHHILYIDPDGSGGSVITLNAIDSSGTGNHGNTYKTVTCVEPPVDVSQATFDFQALTYYQLMAQGIAAGTILMSGRANNNAIIPDTVDNLLQTFFTDLQNDVFVINSKAVVPG